MVGNWQVATAALPQCYVFGDAQLVVSAICDLELNSEPVPLLLWTSVASPVKCGLIPTNLHLSEGRCSN